MNGDTAIANILKLEGTEYLFCYPANTLIVEEIPGVMIAANVGTDIAIKESIKYPNALEVCVSSSP